MKTLRSNLPLLSIVLLWTVCSVWQVRAEVKVVKLCGRDFIRAVVYTCGGSRWRRQLSPQRMEELYNGEQNSAEDLSETKGFDLSARDLSDMMTDKCCQLGCQKRDLKYLC